MTGGDKAELPEYKRIEAQLEYAASHDPLTNLFNRPYFMQQAAAALARAKADTATCFAVLLLDLDRFKLINDSLGHAQGDVALIEIAGRLHRCTRNNDILARLGSDEFAVLIEHFDGENVTPMVGRILEVIRQPITLAKQEVYTSGSIGIVYGDAAYESTEDMVRDARLALDEAKRRNAGFIVFDGGVHRSAALAAQLSSELQRAVVRSEFFLEYQPIFDLATQRIRGVEALIRWQHPVHGRLYPGAFIHQAEETGLIRSIGEKMLRAACVQMQAWQRELPDPMFRLNFNISGLEITDVNFIANLQDILQDTGIPPRLLQLEVTENVLLPSTEPVGEIITQAKGFGVRLLLDDFGTAYSSLGYLDRYPIDGIKIDRSFVEGMRSRPRTRTIVKAIVDLAHALDMDTTAEGVEELEQMTMLQDLGCKHAQGFYLAKPVAAAVITELRSAYFAKNS